MKILVANDDGITADGIILLAKLARNFGDVTVVAPDHQCTATSQHIDIFSELILKKAEDFPVEGVTAYSYSGSPADCVRAGIRYLIPEKPDWVFTGINYGFNAGFDCAYSGTVGAAFESVMHGVPAIAWSNNKWEHFELIEEYLPQIAETLMSKPVLKNAIWNVNFPGCGLDEFQGVEYDRLIGQSEMYISRYQELLKEDGSVGLKFIAQPIEADKAPAGTDLLSLATNHISVGTLKSFVMN